MSLAVAGFFAACDNEDNGPRIEDYPLNYQIEEVPVTEDIPVGAMLVNTASMTNESNWERIVEAYNAADGSVGPYVLPEQGAYTLMGTRPEQIATNAANLGRLVDWAREAGVDFFITPPVRINDDLEYPNNLNADDSTFINMIGGRLGDESLWHNDGSFHYAIQVDMSSLSGAFDNNTNKKTLETRTGQKRYRQPDGTYKWVNVKTRMYDFFRRIARTMADPTYQTVDGKPMLVLSNLRLFYCADSKQVYDTIRTAIKEVIGKDVFLVASQPSWTPCARWQYFWLNGGVDAIYELNMCNTAGYNERVYWLDQLIDQHFKGNRAQLEQYAPGIDYIPSVSNGYNIYLATGNKNSLSTIVQPGVESLRKKCNVAKMNLGRHKMVIIDAFNDWQYGSFIEPTEEGYGNGVGDAYLKIIRDEFKLKK